MLVVLDISIFMRSTLLKYKAQCASLLFLSKTHKYWGLNGVKRKVFRSVFFTPECSIDLTSSLISVTVVGALYFSRYDFLICV